MKRTDDYIDISENDIYIVDILEWYHEGYEFGHPCLMLSPVIREDSDSNSYSLMESTFIDAVIDKKLKYNTEETQILWRGWNLKYLKRVFIECLNGKKFPKAKYKATRYKIKIITDKHNDLTFDILN